MIIWPDFRMGQHRVNDHPYHTPQFNVQKRINNNNLMLNNLSQSVLESRILTQIKDLDQSSKKNIFLLKIFIRWFVFVEKKILISLNSLIWKTKSTNKYWFENSSTNSTNQRIKFSLICKNVNEFSTKIPINPPNFQRIMRNQWQFSKHRPISNKISTNSKIFWEFSLIRWNFRWKFVEIL